VAAVQKTQVDATNSYLVAGAAALAVVLVVAGAAALPLQQQHRQPVTRKLAAKTMTPNAIIFFIVSPC
jgi:hypothetical protein